MKLRTRLIVSFFSIMFLPILLFYFCFTLITNYQLKSVEQTYGIENATELFYGGSIQMFESMTDDIQSEIEQLSTTSPDSFLDPQRLGMINKELEKHYSFLIVRIDGTMIYWGGSVADTQLKEGLINQLPSWNDQLQDEEFCTYTGTKTKCLIKNKDFKMTDNKKCSVFIVTHVGDVLPEVKTLVYEMLIMVCVILFITAAALSMWIYRSMVSPLSKLKKATREIRDGNMDFSIEVETHDEIGELFQNFEEMRMRLKESSEEKIKYDRESKELISNISHDLKTPITSIKGYVEGIMDGVADSPEKVDRYIRTVYNKANDMSRLIDELTFYTKIDTNKIPYNFCKINVYDYFCDCIEEVGLELESRGILLGYSNNAEQDTKIIADGEQLKRVINNIISNSVKYMDKPRGVIDIRIKDLGDFIQIEIEDNGAGIPKKDLVNIFNRFYRTDASRNSLKGGSGIGLSIVRKIIEDHGGRIWCTSTEGVGTVMHFVLRKYQEVENDEQIIDYRR